MLPSLLAALGGLALFALAGWGVTSLSPALRRLPPFRRAGYSYLVGVAAVAGGLYLASHLAGLPLRRPAVLAIVLPLAALALAPRLRRTQGAEPGPGRSRPLAPPFPSFRRRPGEALSAWGLRLGRLALPLFAALVSLGLLADAVSRPLEDWDGRMTWSARAKHLRAEGTVDPRVLLDGRWSASHPRYPVLLPVAQVALQEVFATPEDDPAFRALYPAFLAALLLVLYDGALRWAGPPAARLAVALLAATPFLTFGLDGGALGAYSDLPLAAFYGGAAVLLFERRGDTASRLAGALLLGAAVLTKNEGGPLALWLTAIVAFDRLAWRRPRPRPAPRVRWVPVLLAATLALAALAFRADWESAIPNREDESYGDLLAQGLPALAKIPGHLAAALPEVAKQAFSWRGWLLLPWVAPLVLLLGRRGLGGRRRRLSFALALAAAGPVLLALAAYGLHWDPESLARVTWNRLFLHGIVPLGVLLALAARGAPEPSRSAEGAAGDPPGPAFARRDQGLEP